MSPLVVFCRNLLKFIETSTVSIVHDDGFFVKCENKKNSKKFFPFGAPKQKNFFRYRLNKNNLQIFQSII
ncbi:hypothetical protein B4113_1006 [Geobacillus sp. B4113_201601]|nr:hypothetical protein B4113_1006 [Geobacillus sp. B4113_201601]